MIKNIRFLLNSVRIFLLQPILCLCLFAGCIYLNFEHLGSVFRWNMSDSLPFSAFKSSPVKEIKKGMYVSIRHPKSNLNLAKQVVGSPGDKIQIIQNHVWVAGNDYGAILDKSRSGKPLKPISIQTIPQDHFFVHATHPESFDSRYEEFGLIHQNQIREILWPLF